MVKVSGSLRCQMRRTAEVSDGDEPPLTLQLTLS